MITPKIADLTGEDVLALRAFLDSPAGSRFFPQLVDHVPPLLDGTDVNKALVRMGEVRGWQAALQAIITLAYPPAPPEKDPTSYPDPTDDSAWNDGQKLDTNPR